MIKLLPCLMPIVVSFAVGAIIREKMMNDMRALNELILDLRLMQPCIRLERKTLSETLRHLSKCGKLTALWNELLSYSNRGEDIRSLVGKNEALRAVPISCAAEVQAYFASFGRGDAETETEKLNALIEKLEQTEISLRAEREKKIKLVMPLSVMAGSVIALVMM